MIGTVVALAIAKAVALRQFAIPVGAPIAGAVLLAGAVAVAVVQSDAWLPSLFGVYRRATGAVMYWTYILGFLVAVLVWTEDSCRRLLAGLVASGALVGVYGTVQMLGRDVLPWQEVYQGAPATLGNPNFLSGFMAVVLPVAVWGVLATEHRGWQRAGWGFAAVAVGGGLVASGSLQGFLAGAVGVAVVLAAGATARHRRRAPAEGDGRSHALPWKLFAVLLGVAVVTALLASALKVPEVFADRLGRRIDYWQTAWPMFVDNAFLGVGFDRFGAYDRAYRNAEEALRFGGVGAFVDNPHSVPVAMLIGGGLVLGLAYLAFLAVMAVVIVRLWRTSTGEQFLMVAALAGAWSAYQMQSLVSIDVPALAWSHWLVASALVALTRPASRVISLGSARARTGPVPLAAGSAVAILAVALALLPWSHDLAAGSGMRLQASRDFFGADSAYQRAASGLAWRSEYAFELAVVRVDVGDVAGARQALERSLGADPRNIQALMVGARVEAAMGNHEEALLRYERSLVVEPQHPEVILEVAGYLLDRGETGRARRLVERVLVLTPADPAALELMEKIKAV